MMRLSVMVIACLLHIHSFAQTDTLPLPEVQVIESPLAIVAEQEAFQNEEALNNSWSNLAQLNELAPAFFINQFSARGLASPNFRGLGYERTLVQWNGLSINSPANGGIDYQLISSQAGNSWNFYSGGHGALAGSGAIGGVLAIKENWRNKSDYAHSASLSYNQFQDINNRLKFSWKANNYLGNAKLSSAFGGKSYSFRQNGISRTRGNTQSASIHILQNNQWKIKRHLLATHLWGNYSKRQLPANLFASYNGDKQTDQNLRFVLNHQFNGSQGIFKNSIGALMENIQFENNLFSLNPTIVYRGQYNGSYETALPREWHLILGWQSAVEWSDSYRNEVNQFITLSGFATIKKSWKKQLFSASLRPTVRINGDRPLNGFLSYQINFDRIALLAKVSRDYRQPTLNDLYWIGPMEEGNPTLLSENSWNQELQFNYHWNSALHNWKFSTTIFSTLVDNWIQWRFDQTWSPQNLKKVWTRGATFHLSYQLQRQKWALVTKGSYTFNPVSEVQVDPIGTTLLSNQLIRSPLHQGNLSAALRYQKWSLRYAHRLVGARKLTADDSSRAAAFHLANSQLRYAISKQWIASFQVNNLWNAYYEHVPGQPLPGISYQLQVDFSF